MFEVCFITTETNNKQMKKRIIISATSDLSTDQRVQKVAGTCYKNGYDVLLIGRKLVDSKKINRPYKVKRFRLLFNKSGAFYAEYNIRLFLLLLFSKADIYISNDTDTLPANFLAAKIRRRKLLFDAHELFPEVPELADRPRVKQVWKKIEDIIFPHLKNCYTVCSSIAEHYNKEYGINMKVVRNVPFTKEKQLKKLPKYPNKKIILYQGALNIGRGLEWVIDAMPFLENVVLVVFGDGDIRMQLEEQVEKLHLSEKVVFMGKVDGDELHQYTPSADIGLCLLENKGLSYYYSLPNRIFDYLHAGVPVLASRFPEISAIVETHRTGVCIDHYEPEYLAKTIHQMLENPIDIKHFEELSSEFCWEKEEKVLMKLIEEKNH